MYSHLLVYKTQTESKVITIENEKKLLGTKLLNADGSIEWTITSIVKHLHHYVIFIEQTESGWERKVLLDRTFTENKEGRQYKLECGSKKIYLFKDVIDNMSTFSRMLDYFIQ